VVAADPALAFDGAASTAAEPRVRISVELDAKLRARELQPKDNARCG
jgi:hypothetical protein